MASSSWEKTDELYSDVFRVLQNKLAGPVAIVATTDSDGYPHTAPFGSVTATDKHTLRFGCDRRHDTYSNIQRNGLVTVSIVAPPNIAVSIKGKARVLKKEMGCLNTDAVIEILLVSVKNDFLPGTTIETGVKYSVSTGALKLIENYIAEILAA